MARRQRLQMVGGDDLLDDGLGAAIAGWHLWELVITCGALLQQLGDAHFRLGDIEQGAAHVVARDAAQDLKRIGLQGEHQVAGGEGGLVFWIEHEAPTGRNDQVLKRRQFGGDLAFQAAELLPPIGSKDIRDLFSCTLHD